MLPSQDRATDQFGDLRGHPSFEIQNCRFERCSVVVNRAEHLIAWSTQKTSDHPSLMAMVNVENLMRLICFVGITYSADTPLH